MGQNCILYNEVKLLYEIVPLFSVCRRAAGFDHLGHGRYCWNCLENTVRENSVAPASRKCPATQCASTIPLWALRKILGERSISLASYSMANFWHLQRAPDFKRTVTIGT